MYFIPECPVSDSVPMDLFTLIPRTIVGVTYPAFASLKAVLSDSPESCGAWLRYVQLECLFYSATVENGTQFADK